MKALKDKYFTFNEFVIHYLEKEADGDIYVVFPPGIQDARFVNLQPISFPQNSCLITISYPSRYKSSDLLIDNSIENISDKIYFFAKYLIETRKMKKINLVGFSFGTAVVTKLMQNHPDLKINSIYLINPGEFFSSSFNTLFQKAFKPALFNSRYARLLKYILVKVLKVFNSEYFPDNRLIYINQQWLSILKYRIDSKIMIDVKTTIISGDNDFIISKNSLEKLKQVYTYTEELVYRGGHLYDYYNLNQTTKLSVLSKQLFPAISTKSPTF